MNLSPNVKHPNQGPQNKAEVYRPKREEFTLKQTVTFDA